MSEDFVIILLERVLHLTQSSDMKYTQLYLLMKQTVTYLASLPIKVISECFEMYN